MKERVPVWLVALALLASVGGRAEPMREDSGPRPATAQGRPAPVPATLPARRAGYHARRISVASARAPPRRRGRS